MIFSLDQITNWLLAYRYLVLFPLIILEGPIVSMTAGFLSSINLLNIFIVYPVVVAADLIGDIFYYSIGRWGRKKFLHKYGKYLRLKEENIEKIEAHFSKHTKITIIIGKISHAFGAPILVAAGISRVPIYEIFWSNFIVTLPKYLILLTIGYYFGQVYIRSSGEYYNYLTFAILILIILVIVIYLIYKKYKSRFDKYLNKLSKKDILNVK